MNECKCGHDEAAHVAGHGCTAREDDKSECECGGFFERIPGSGRDTPKEYEVMIGVSIIADGVGEATAKAEALVSSMLDDYGLTTAFVESVGDPDAPEYDDDDDLEDFDDLDDEEEG